MDAKIAPQGVTIAREFTDIDHHSAAIGLVALIDGLWLELSIDDKVVSRGKAIELCLRYIDQQFGLDNVAFKKRSAEKRAGTS